MTENIIEDWLGEYAGLSPEELRTFIDTTRNNKEIIIAVHSVLDDRQKFISVIDRVCTTLFDFYRSREVDLQRFTLIFLPTLIYGYLNAVAHGEKKSCRGIEAVLVGIYNLEALDDNGQSKNIAFRLPSLAQSSIYHEPMSLAPASLTENALRRLEECDTKLVRWSPLPQADRIVAQNRLQVISYLLFVFNTHIASLHSDALHHLCKVASKLVSQGFSKPGKRVSYSNDVTPVLPRIPISQPFLLELLHSIYFAIFNGHESVGLQAVEEIHQRACYQCLSDVLLVTNAIKSSAHLAGAGSDVKPMGISMSVSPATTSANVSKSMITNASFRTKKLPEDIPIQVNKSEGDSSGLGSISEEKEDKEGLIIMSSGGSEVPIGGSSGGPRRSLPKMAVTFGKRTRDRLARVSHKAKLINGATNTSELPQEQSIEDDGDSGLSELVTPHDSPVVPTMQVSSV